MNVLACSASSKDLFFLFFLICVPLAILRDHEPFNLLDPLTLRLHTRHSQNCKLVTTKFSPQPATHRKCHHCSQVNSLEFIYIYVIRYAFRLLYFQCLQFMLIVWSRTYFTRLAPRRLLSTCLIPLCLLLCLLSSQNLTL